MRTLFALAFATIVGAAHGVDFLIMPDSTNNRVVTFDAHTGALLNSSLFTIASGTTPIHAMQVGNEIWISEQLGDKISRYTPTGTLLGSISGGLDNIRGMALIGNTVYVTNAGTANGAPGAAVVKFDTNGNNLGFVNMTGLAPSPFGILSHQGDILVSSSSANNDIHRFDSNLVSIGAFHNSTGLNFAEQMDHDVNGDVLVAGFSTPSGIYRLDKNTGAILATYAAGGGQRGVKQLGNGNILWTNGSGAHVYDVINGTSTQVYSGGGRYIDTYTAVPEPATLTMVGLGLAALARRRRRTA